MQPTTTNITLGAFVQLLLSQLRIDICAILYVDLTPADDHQPPSRPTLDAVVAAAAAHPNSSSLHYTPATDAWLSHVQSSPDAWNWNLRAHFGTEDLSGARRVLCVHVLTGGFLGGAIEVNWRALRQRHGRDLFRLHHLVCVDVAAELDDQFRASVLANAPNAVVAAVQERTVGGRKQVQVGRVHRAVEFEREWTAAGFRAELATNANEWG